MAFNRRHIADILEMETISTNQEDNEFTVLAKIVELDHNSGWCYASCSKCNNNLEAIDGSFVCSICNQQCRYPIIRYKIHVHVIDGSGRTTFVIFNQEAEKLLDSCANKFVNRLGIGSNQFPEEIIDLTGKIFIFKIKVALYNVTYECETYEVIKLYDVKFLIAYTSPKPFVGVFDPEALSAVQYNFNLDWLIQARLCRMWEAINFKNDNEIMGLEMVFVDDKGDSIQAYIRKNHMKRYKPMLEESEVYAIRNFRVAKSAVQYKVVPNEHRVYFNTTTSVRKVANVSHQIPPNVFFFTSDQTHEERVYNNTLLTDIIGCVVGVGEIEYVGKAMKKKIELKTETEKIMNVTLWGNISGMFDYSPYKGDDTPVIAIITSTTIKSFQGQLRYASTTATGIYFNLDIHEVKSLRTRFSYTSAQLSENIYTCPEICAIIYVRFAEGNEGIKLLESEHIVHVPLAEQMSLNRRTIGEILAMEWISDNQERVFTVLAKIVEIEERYGWCYVSCNQCIKKVVPTNGSFLCNTCNKECSYPIIRYKIHVRVTDESGTTTLVIFDQDAEKLLDASAKKFMNRLGTGNNQIPAEISNLTGKSFVFKIKLTNYNLKDGFENYTVVKIFDTDKSVETYEFRSENAEEAEIKGKRNAGEMLTDGKDGLGKNVLAATGVGGSTSGGGSLIDPVTPEKKFVHTKKIKNGE
ncbi:hypothetical protein LXL04_035390 [Taraxacum kok-saghyz]